MACSDLRDKPKKSSRGHHCGSMRVSLGLLAKGLVWSFCLSSVFILWGHLQGRRTEWNVERSQIPEISARFDVREARQEVNTGLCVVKGLKLLSL